MVVVSVLVAAVLGGVWFVLRGDGFLRAMGVVLLAAAGLWAATSASESTRAGMWTCGPSSDEGPSERPLTSTQEA